MTTLAARLRAWWHGSAPFPDPPSPAAHARLLDAWYANPARRWDRW